MYDLGMICHFHVESFVLNSTGILTSLFFVPIFVCLFCYFYPDRNRPFSSLKTMIERQISPYH